jgi:NodT family efflux transporter outer membrane factor (OMF) lipoprotein
MKCMTIPSRSILLLTLLLAGCGTLMHTPYQRPEVELPQTWTHSHENLGSTQGRWWEGFGDPSLNRLVAEALERNNDLAAAAIRVRQAQLQAELAGSALLPSLNVAGSASHSRELRSNTRETNTFGTSVSSSYKADIWGELTSEYDAARWEAQASEEDRANTALALTGTTASLYWQIGYLNQRVALSEASIAYARRTLELVRVQKAAGAATSLEILEAERSLASQEANHATLVQQRVEARNGLAILFDSPPHRLETSEPHALDRIQLPEVAAGLPAYLLARRPDLRAAEARLRSALAATDASRASFYPSINLSGSLGRSSEELSRIVSNPIGTLAVDLALPFVQWRDMQRTVKNSEAEYEQAVRAFRQTLYNALAEVENSLSARQQYRDQGEKLELTLRAARQTEELYRIRYLAGGSPLKTWLDAQENRRQAEINLATNRLSQLQNHIALVKALGGDTGSPLNGQVRSSLPNRPADEVGSPAGKPNGG